MKINRAIIHHSVNIGDTS